MARVRVYRITSVNDPMTGKAGKQIELVEVRAPPAPFMPFTGGEEETKIVKGIISQFQSAGLVPQIREALLPKITLILTEEEYDMLGVRFEVNEIYDLEMRDGAMKLNRPQEGV